MTTMRRPRLIAAIDRLETAEWLDPAVGVVRTAVDSTLRSQSFRDLLHGTPIGHPVHPLAAQVPLGAWVSAAVLDLIPGSQAASRALVGVGVASALPAAVAGYNDWSKLHEQQLRVGLVHSTANLVATSLYVLSFVQRSRGRHTSGRLLGFAGLAVVTGAGFLGGHLSYRQAAGANHTEHVPHLFPTGWHDLAPLEEIPDGQLDRREVAGTPLLVHRRGAAVDVLSDICSHLSAPLHEGELTGDSDPCVTCPWHGSVFSLKSGEVVHGPATVGQPRFDTRVRDGVVQVSLPGAG